MAYQDIPTGSTPGAGAGSGEVLVTATDTTGGFLNDSLTTTAADITKAVVNGGADETLNLSLPNVGPGAVTSGSATAPIETATTDARGRILSFTTAVARDVPANWALTLVRYFLVDYDAGNDSNVGYIDAAAGTVHSGAAVAAAAIKTFTKLMTIIPLLGNGRSMVVLAKSRAAGATYLDNDAVTESSVYWGGLSGYKLILRRGSTDLTNSVTDRLLCGFVTALAGPNGDGSFTCTAGATTTVFTIAAGALTAEPGLIGMRVRFTGNITAGLANSCMNIASNTGTVITLAAAIGGGTPANGDTFLIEVPGFAVSEWIDNSMANGDGGSATATYHTGALSTIRDVGVTATATTTTAMYLRGGDRAVAGLNLTSTGSNPELHLRDMMTFMLASSYPDETNTTRQIGLGLRTVGAGMGIDRILQCTIGAFAWARTAAPPDFCHITNIGAGNMFSQGSYLKGDVRIRSSGGTGIDGTTNQGLWLGNGAGTVGRLRLLGTTWSIIASSLAFVGLQFGAITGNGINVASMGCTLQFDNLVNEAATTVTGYAIAANFGGYKNRLIMGTTATNTATGTLGDIQAGGGAIISHAALALTNVVDSLGQEWIGTAGSLVGPCVLVTNSSGGALAVGEIVRKNATTTQVVTAQGDTAANAVYAGVMVTAPASGALGYMVTDGAPYALFDGAPTLGNIAYLSPGTARKATTTVPAVASTNQKLRLGRVLTASGSTGRLLLQPEIIPVTADGLL